MFLQLSGLCSGYGLTPIVANVELQVEKGEICVILGRNGVGKTTLMKTIIGLLPVTSGKIVFNGQPIERMPSNQRARLGIGYVPQGRGIFPDLTVLENLMMGEGINDKSRKRPYEEIYSFFPRLKERLRQKGGSLSGGEQQMLAIGRALIGDPPILLLDEPSEGVQPNIVEDIGRILARLNRENGLTILLVEQNIDYALGIATDCRIMNKGRLIDDVGKKELLDAETAKKYLAI